jgi:hypothetical protein
MSFPDLDQNGVRLLCELLLNDMGCFSMIQKSALSLCILMALIGPSQSISNGASVSEDDPISGLTVSIYGQNDDCTGVKVARSFVLTARHCEIDKSTRIILSDRSSYTIAQYFEPSARSTGVEHDLALIKIQGEMPGPVADLADEAITPGNGSAAWVAGFGGKKITESDYPLRKLAVTILDRDYSSSLISVRTRAGGTVCDGDSGGPGYTTINNRIVLWGIDSAGVYGNRKCASTELYAKVSSEYDWIRRTINGEYTVSGRKNK